MDAQLVQDAASSMKAPLHRAYNPKESLSEGSSSAKPVEVPPMGHSLSRQVDGDFEHSACRHKQIWQDGIATMVDSVSLDHSCNLQQRKTQNVLSKSELMDPSQVQGVTTSVVCPDDPLSSMHGEGTADDPRSTLGERHTGRSDPRAEMPSDFELPYHTLVANSPVPSLRNPLAEQPSVLLQPGETQKQTFEANICVFWQTSSKTRRHLWVSCYVEIQKILIYWEQAAVRAH